jgi:peptidoglycan/LPS O-acetylase OafA/YrhL
MSSGGSSFNKNRWPAIDGLRGLAILPVICSHYGLYGNGHAGVVLFFVISGHVITHSLLEEKNKNGRISFKNFYIRRVARLVPMVILTCFLTIVFLLVTSVPFNTWYLDALGMLTFTENLMYLFGLEKDLNYFTYNWSLGFEEQFYLIWPATVFYTLRKSINYKFLLSIALGLVLGLYVTDYYLNNRFDFEFRGYSSLNFFSVILLGAIIAIFLRLANPKYFHSVNHPRAIWLEFFSILVLTLLILNLIGSQFPITFLRENGVLTTTIYGAILILLIIRSEPRWLIWLLTTKPLVQIGKMSFTLYMINFLWLVTLEEVIPEFIKRHGLTTHLAELFTLFLIAWFTYKKFELPMQNRINKKQQS